MSGFFQPSPVVLALLSLQTFFYLPILFVLAIFRTGAARGAARWLGLLSVVLALIGTAAHFGPPMLGFYDGPLPIYAGQITKAGGGMVLPLAASLPLLLSGFVSGRRWKWVDWAHWLLIAVLLGLWGWTRVF